MLKLSIIQKIILAIGVIAFAVRAFTYEYSGSIRSGAIAPNMGIVLQCVAIILVTGVLIFLFHKPDKSKSNNSSNQ